MSIKESFNMNKICSKCGITKDLKDFYICNGRIRPECKDCNIKPKRKYVKIIVPNDMKLCNVCHELKYIKEFSKMKRGNKGVKAICKKCISPLNKAYDNTHKDHKKEYHLIKKYNITLVDWNNMLTDQDNKCSICKIEFNLSCLSNICVDHDHLNGQVRNILCKKCNLIIADNEEKDITNKILKNTILYLDRPDTNYIWYRGWKTRHEKEYKELLNKCDNKCEICGLIFVNKTQSDISCIDHNHKTGMIRGILCNKCNSRIGHINEKPTMLQSFIDYLTKHNGKLKRSD